MENEVNNDKSLNALLRDLESVDLQDYLDFNWSPDPNVNFENFMNILSQAKQRCMPQKIVKFGKKKPGAPNSAKFRGGCRGPSKIRQRGGSGVVANI